MYDPFKRTRTKAKRKARKAAASAVSDFWGAVLTPKTSGSRKSRPIDKRVSNRQKASKGSKGPKRLATKLEPPSTSQSKMVVPRGAYFKDATHRCAFGSRDYKLYIPVSASTSANSLPLVVMLHGCGQTPQDFARGTGMNALAEEFGFLALYPAQTVTAHRNRCWNWFKSADQTRGAGEPALLASMTSFVIAHHAIDPAKVYTAGLSAGGAAAVTLATNYPDIFAAVGVHSGLPAGAAHDATTASRAMQVGNPGRRHADPMPTVIFHGEADKLVNPRNGRFAAIRALEPFPQLNRTERSGKIDGGRAYTKTVYRTGRGRPHVETWIIHGSGHAWSGGHPAGKYTDPKGPDASRQMIKFFLRHRTTKARRSASIG